MPIDEATFRQAMGHFATGVAIVTTEHKGEQFGITVASFASLSLRPPLLLICIEKTAKTHDAIASSKKFAASILAGDQEEISSRFASRRDDKFTDLATRRGKLGLTLIEGAIATIECKLHSTFPGGDHSIFVGEVVEAEMNEARPLLYFQGGYHQLV